jgi:MerR family redox-sensitive transcriptional activator SoxR
MAVQLTIGELASRSGASTSALRFYESKGLLAAARTSGGHRVYERSTLRRVAFIRAAQRVGLSLEEIRAGPPRPADRRARAAARRAW